MDKDKIDHYKKSILTLQKEVKRLNRRIEKWQLLLKDISKHMGHDNYYNFLSLRKAKQEDESK